MIILNKYPYIAIVPTTNIDIKDRCFLSNKFGLNKILRAVPTFLGFILEGVRGWTWGSSSFIYLNRPTTMKDLLRQEIESLNIPTLVELTGHINRYSNCSYCKIPLNKKNSSMDHVIPKWLVTRYVDSKREKIYWNRINKIPSCYECNQQKCGSTLRQWREELLKFPFRPLNMVRIGSINSLLRY